MVADWILYCVARLVDSIVTLAIFQFVAEQDGDRGLTITTSLSQECIKKMIVILVTFPSMAINWALNSSRLVFFSIENGDLGI